MPATLPAAPRAPSFSRRSLLGLLGLLAGGAAVPASSAQPGHEGLPLAVSLRDELAVAVRQGQPLVVLVSLEGCPFCRAVRESYLAPMRREGLPVVQVDWRTARAVADFAGAATTHDALVARWNVKVAPTVLFFGPGGREVAERLRGAMIPDFYGAYLEGRLASARKAVQAARG